MDLYKKSKNISIEKWKKNNMQKYINMYTNHSYIALNIYLLDKLKFDCNYDCFLITSFSYLLSQ